MTATEMKAIETRYKGYRFRSRTEARWAVFFDALQLPWKYEPEGFELGDGLRYLPDFVVTYPDCGDVWFEVKGDPRSMDQRDWQKLLLFSKRNRIYLLDGQPASRMYLEISEWLAKAETSYWPSAWFEFDGKPPHEGPMAELCEGFFHWETGSMRNGIEAPIVKPYRIDKHALDFDRFGAALWSYKGRPWWDEYSNFFDEEYLDLGGADIKHAVTRALSARFEFGEQG